MILPSCQWWCWMNSFLRSSIALRISASSPLLTRYTQSGLVRSQQKYAEIS